LVRRSEPTARPRRPAPSSARARSGHQGHGRGEYVREHTKDSQVFSYLSNANALAELEQRRIDAFVTDGPIAAWYASLDEGALHPLLKPLLTKDEIGWGFRPGDEELREQANRSLARWKRDGTLGGVLRRWLPTWEPIEEPGQATKSKARERIDDREAASDPRCRDRRSGERYGRRSVRMQRTGAKRGAERERGGCGTSGLRGREGRMYAARRRRDARHGPARRRLEGRDRDLRRVHAGEGILGRKGSN
jgi:hypothetical protein